ncbi:MAG: putative hemolysin [Anaerolineae bacterium]
MRSRIALMLAVVALMLVACGTAPGSDAELANPASVFCEEQGGTLEIRTDADGGQVGYCLFDDGSECEEWAYFRGECQPGQ